MKERNDESFDIEDEFLGETAEQDLCRERRRDIALPQGGGGSRQRPCGSPR